MASTTSWFPIAKASSIDSLIRFPKQSAFKPLPVKEDDGQVV